MDEERVMLSQSFHAAEKAAVGKKVTDTFRLRVIDCVGRFTAFAAAHEINVDAADSSAKLLALVDDAHRAGGNKYQPSIVLGKLRSFTTSYLDIFRDQ